MSRYAWVVTAYYGNDAAPPKRPGGLAFETVHANEHGRDLEIEIAEGRADIGLVVFAPLATDDPRQSTPSDARRMRRP